MSIKDLSAQAPSNTPFDATARGSDHPGHGNIATTLGYLHARPDTSSGLHLDPGVLLR